MSEVANDLAELVGSIVRPLVEFEDDLEILPNTEREGSVLIEIRVNPADAGKVIGRQGRIIKAIRTLARAAATRNDVSVDVELID